MARSSLRGAAAVAVAALLCASAHAADIKLSSAWMRPAPAGSNARAYVDIASDTAALERAKTFFD